MMTSTVSAYTRLILRRRNHYERRRRDLPQLVRGDRGPFRLRTPHLVACETGQDPAVGGVDPQLSADARGAYLAEGRNARVMPAFVFNGDACREGIAGVPPSSCQAHHPSCR